MFQCGTFRTPLLFSVLGMAATFAYGYLNESSVKAALGAVGITLLLATLEISISFDNAIANATWLKRMTPAWQKRFLTWGIAIAVFGMRLILPILLVSILGRLSPLESLSLALFNPSQYSLLIISIHHQILSFGGTFLLLVGLRFFLNPDKTVHWLKFVERPLHSCAKLPGLSIALTLLVLFVFAAILPSEDVLPVMETSLAAIILFIVSDGLLGFVDAPESATGMTAVRAARQSLIIFLYLEILDASFSLDGVVGAFALSQNLILIAIGLGIGAFFVRSFTMMLVQKGTLQTLPYLEHGAFYAILFLGGIMLLSLCYEIPDYVSGLASAAIILISFLHSLFQLKSKKKRRG